MYDIQGIMLTKIHFIRHGMTEGNLKHWFYGSIDVPLAPEGEDDIKGFVEQGVYPAMPEGAPVFTSELRRTEDTMRCIYGNIPHEKLAGFNEYHYGRFEGLLFPEVMADPDYVEYMNDETGMMPIPGGGDSGHSFRTRIAAALEHVLDVHTAHWNPDDPDPSSFAFVHGGTISMIMRIFFPDEPYDIWGWIPDPGLGFTVYFDGRKPVRYERIGGESVLGPTGLSAEELQSLRDAKSGKIVT